MYLLVQQHFCLLLYAVRVGVNGDAGQHRDLDAWQLGECGFWLGVYGLSRLGCHSHRFRPDFLRLHARQKHLYQHTRRRGPYKVDAMLTACKVR